MKREPKPDFAFWQSVGHGVMIENCNNLPPYRVHRVWSSKEWARGHLITTYYKEYATQRGALIAAKRLSKNFCYPEGEA